MTPTNTTSASQIRRDAKEALNDDRMYYRIIAMPICFGEIIWDFADTVCDQCRFLADPALKALPRQLKELRRFYSAYYLGKGLTNAHLAPLLAYKEGYITDPNGVGAVYNAIFSIIKRKYPDMSVGYQMLYTVLWQMKVFGDALRIFSAKAESDFAKKIGLPDFGSILPPEIRKLPEVIKPFCLHADIGAGTAGQIAADLSDEFDRIASDATESPERTRHRHRCIAYICNGGCREGAVGSEIFGCYPAASCRWMERFDKK